MPALSLRVQLEVASLYPTRHQGPFVVYALYGRVTGTAIAPSSKEVSGSTDGLQGGPELVPCGRWEAGGGNLET